MLGINSVGFDAALSTYAYNPEDTAALAETALETSSSETMDALIAQLGGAVQIKAGEIFNALPADVQAILMEL